MQLDRVSARRVVLAMAVLLGAAAGAAGCNGGGGVKGGHGGAKEQGDASVDTINIATDGSSGNPDMASCVAKPGKGDTVLGQDCVCHSDCGSGFCVDGVCCNSACGDKCNSCSLPGSEGTCTVVPEGVKPRDAVECEASPEMSCGLDGTCDGLGGCRKHVLGTVCFGGTCDGDGMSGVNICDGAGACRLGPASSCFPYTCAGDKCLSKCTADKDCSAGRTCMGNSCGKLPTGRGPCTTDDECSSDHCADGVCCNVGCSGACVSCNQTGFIGQCRPVGAGLPHTLCAVQPRASCGTTGVCDGFGSCALYPAETTCIPPKCAGNMLNTAGTCDGEGTCQSPGQIDCAPFLCTGESCVKTCTTDAQCVAPNVCVNGSCGKKSMGSSCTAAAQCLSNQCVDGVCCDSPCTGACQSCALKSSLGQCKNVAAGAADPHAQCKDTGAASCGTNGKCDGAGGCRKYAVDADCSAETCAGGAYTPAGACSATGQCIPPAKQPCAPYACNGTKCFEICSSNAQCLAPNTCVNGSCGLKPLGAKCSVAAECQFASDGKQYCSQGVCCSGGCTTACQACNLAGSLGMCVAVPNNAVDPQKKCATTAVGTCGTNGKCRLGVCDTYHTTDQCRPASCSNANTSLDPAFCDGRGGTCPAATANGCGLYTCEGATGRCKKSCTTKADCSGSNTCNSGACGINECSPNPCLNGGTCTDGAGTFTCKCPTGFTGATCQTNPNNCSPNPCMNGGICTDGTDRFTCDCPAGFTGSTCQTTISHCSPNPCLNGGACTNGTNGYTCECRAGFTGTTCQTNINDCSPNPCMHGGTCTDGANKFTCDCPAGFSGATCQKIVDKCSPNPCMNGGTCTGGANKVTCDCPAGYKGNRCQNGPK